MCYAEGSIGFNYAQMLPKNMLTAHEQAIC